MQVWLRSDRDLILIPVPEQLVTPQKTNNNGHFSIKWLPLLVLLVAGPIAVQSQDQDAYYAIIQTVERRTFLQGFLYAVDDSMVRILPGRPTIKGLNISLSREQPLAVPLKLVKQVKITKVRKGSRHLFNFSWIALVYSVGFSFVVPVQTLAELVAFDAVVFTGTLFTYDRLYWRRHNTSEATFNIAMQKYCLKKMELVQEW